MTDIGDGPFQQGEPIWVMEADGSQRPAEYIGVRETMDRWFGGPPPSWSSTPTHAQEEP